MFNLIKNAVFHTSRAGKGDVSVYIRRDGSHGEIVVHDTGPGIAAEFLPRIFDRFVTTAPRSDIGLGIGLAFCRDAVDRMKGDIRCESVCGQFATFTIRFPIATA